MKANWAAKGVISLMTGLIMHSHVLAWFNKFNSLIKFIFKPLLHPPSCFACLCCLELHSASNLLYLRFGKPYNYCCCFIRQTKNELTECWMKSMNELASKDWKMNETKLQFWLNGNSPWRMTNIRIIINKTYAVKFQLPLFQLNLVSWN